MRLSRKELGANLSTSSDEADLERFFRPKTLITGGPTTLSIWDLELDSLIERAARLAGRELTASERERYMLTAP